MLCRLLSYVGRMAAFGIALSGPAEPNSLSEEQLSSASKTVLLAIEVSDVLLGMASKAQQRRQKPLDLSALMLNEGKSSYRRAIGHSTHSRGSMSYSAGLKNGCQGCAAFRLSSTFWQAEGTPRARLLTPAVLISA